MNDQYSMNRVRLPISDRESEKKISKDIGAEEYDRNKKQLGERITDHGG
jgi:hypothetical protein